LNTVNTIEQSKNFELTNQEENLLNKFIERYYPLVKENYALPSTFVAERIAAEITENLKEHKWFFARALSSICHGLRLSSSTNNYEHTLPDRKLFKFKFAELKKSLFDLGRFYYARMFNHRYENLRSTSKNWIDLDDYVVNREKQVKLTKLQKKLPELKGIF